MEKGLKPGKNGNLNLVKVLDPFDAKCQHDELMDLAGIVLSYMPSLFLLFILFTLMLDLVWFGLTKDPKLWIE